MSLMRKWRLLILNLKFNFMLKWRRAYAGPYQSGEVNTLPSLTIPDQTMSLKEILDRYTHGLPFDDVRTPVYHGDVDVPDMSRLDLVEQHELIDRNRDRIRSLQNDLNERAKRSSQPSAGGQLPAFAPTVGASSGADSVSGDDVPVPPGAGR